MKNTDPAALKGYDAGKKVSGIKRHIAVDTLGLPHAVAVTTADVTDRKGALQALRHSKDTLGQVGSVLVDGGYTGRPFERGVREILLPAGTMMIKNALNDADYTCALVLSGLRNVRIVGRKGTKFIVGSGGGGSAEFGMFRLEQCEDVEFCGFEMDGSGITITGVGSMSRPAVSL